MKGARENKKSKKYFVKILFGIFWGVQKVDGVTWIFFRVFSRIEGSFTLSP